MSDGKKQDVGNCPRSPQENLNPSDFRTHRFDSDGGKRDTDHVVTPATSLLSFQRVLQVS